MNGLKRRCWACNNEFLVCHENKKYCSKNCEETVRSLQNKIRLIRRRCTNPKAENHSYYKDKKICLDWARNDYKFIKWGIENGFRLGLTIDRINNDLGYYPNNCRFVTMTENHRNRKYLVTDFTSKTRICRICKTKNSLTFFNIENGRPLNRSYLCKVCHRKYSRDRYKKAVNLTRKVKNGN